MKPTLLVLAAGMGSRYGGNKQLDQVGPSGETIIDYSIYDAKRAGFGKVVFVIRRDIEEQFRETFVRRLKDVIEIDYVFQELGNLPSGFKVPEGRQKPWGTSHAILVTEPKIHEPFGVINADDYYGVDSFNVLYDFLTKDKDDTNFSIVGYKLGNTLSDHGHVNRGICRVSDDGFLMNMVETRGIEKRPDGIFAPDTEGKINQYTGNEIVSMNLFGFKPSVYRYLNIEFSNFLRERISDPKAELDIPTSLDKFVKKGEITIRILSSNSQWFGVTYREDKPFVVESIRKMVEAGVYPEKLF
ncbi:MAG: NTP transferase domain-containing protein [Bacteroidales bacterium]